MYFNTKINSKEKFPNSGYASLSKSPIRSKIYDFIPVLSIGVFLIIWFLISHLTELGNIFLPSPIKVFEKFLIDILDIKILEYIGMTLLESFSASILGSVLGLFLALGIYKSKILDKTMHPFIAMSQSIPAIALAPLLVLWVGYGFKSIVILCTIIVFFPIFISTLTGLKNIDREIIEAAKLDGAKGKKLFINIEFPLSLPCFLSGVRNGFTLSITGSIVGEIVMGGNGLGTLLTIYRNNLDITGMFSTIVMLCLISLTVYQSILFYERKNMIIQSINTQTNYMY